MQTFCRHSVVCRRCITDMYSADFQNEARQPLWYLNLQGKILEARGSVVVKALYYKPEGRGFEAR
jgi:hypothetical protein